MSSIIWSIVAIAKEIDNIATTVKINRRRCRRLVERLQLLTKELNRLNEDEQASKEDTLKTTLQVVKYARNLCESYQQMTWYNRIYGAATGKIEDDFSDMNNRLQNCIDALHLSVSADSRELLLNYGAKYAIDYEADLNGMRTELEKLSEEEHRKQEDLIRIRSALNIVQWKLDRNLSQLKESQATLLNRQSSMMSDIASIKTHLQVGVSTGQLHNATNAASSSHSSQQSQNLKSKLEARRSAINKSYHSL